ncbi:hypothetical protein [Nocardia acidivorans]|uniref:hypothetical protein n=1 Tax=Nocardia acidivorans TaxID=404580 RepID=UPI00082ECC77|nr:hypothetical protein [Nocardia acidivorans]
MNEDDAVQGGAMAAGTIPRPPWTPELLADLHAGNVPADLSAQLWAQVRRDPEAMRYLRSLDQVNLRLRDLGRDEHIVHPMPVEITSRLERMIDDLAATEPAEPGLLATVHRLPVPRQSTHPAPPSTAPMPVLNGSAMFDTGQLDPRELGDLTPEELEQDEYEPIGEPGRGEQRFSRRLRWLTAAAAAAAILAGGVVAVDAVHNRNAAPAPAQPADNTLAADFAPVDVLTAMGRHDISGPLAKGNALSACLAAAQLDRPVLGSRTVTYTGQPAVLVLLAGPQAPQITAAVLGNGCTAADPQVLTSVDIG